MSFIAITLALQSQDTPIKSFNVRKKDFCDSASKTVETPECNAGAKFRSNQTPPRCAWAADDTTLRDKVMVLLDPDYGPASPEPADMRRMGRQQPGGGGRARPLLTTWGSVPDKLAALKRKGTLRAKGIGIQPYLTSAQRTAKKAKQPASAALFKDGKRPFWRGAQLFFKAGDQITEWLPPPPPLPPRPANPQGTGSGPWGSGSGTSGAGRGSGRGAGCGAASFRTNLLEY